MNRFKRLCRIDKIQLEIGRATELTESVSADMCRFRRCAPA